MKASVEPLVSWNGSDFDPPVLHYRSLVHKVVAERYWENGSKDSSFRYNNYFNRYHERHTDLINVPAGLSAQCNAPLHDVSRLLGASGRV
jgi:3'-5' exonuclease